MIVHIYNEKINKYISCIAYSSKNHFVANKCLSLNIDGNTYYVPLDRLSDEYDSSLRALIENNKYQICTSLPINVVNKYFPGGNLFIPLTSYQTLYKLFIGMFGEFHVKLKENGVLFKAPMTLSGLTKMFITGLNVSLTYNDTTWTTTYNGLSDKIYKKDNLLSRSMLVKFVPEKNYLISFNDSFKSLNYSNEIVKNFIIIGYEVEQLKETSGDYKRLILTDEYYLYDENKHVINKIGQYAEQMKYINFAKNNYLKKENTSYNYYLLQQPICEKG